MNLKERIHNGINGNYKGLNNGFDRLNSVIFGIQRGVYILLGGNSGTGKSTVVDYMLLNAIRDAEQRGIKLNVFYYSFEIDELSKKCNWLSNYIYQKHNIVIPTEKIKGLGDNRLEDWELALIDECIPEVEEIFNKINFTFSSINPTGVRNELIKFMEARGRFDKKPYIDSNGDTKEKIVRYVPNDPDEYNLVILDHMALLHKERGFQTKEVIDKYSEYCTSLRNLYGISFINIQQFNQSLSSIERIKFKGADLSPSQSDFRDSTNPYNDCDVALGLMCPRKLDITESLKYDITVLKEKFLLLKVIKNRLSRDNVSIGLYANFKAGSFEELPPAEQMTPADYIKYSK